MYQFTLDQINKILSTLGEVPAKVSFETILMIHEIVSAQTKKQEEKAE